MGQNVEHVAVEPPGPLAYRWKRFEPTHTHSPCTTSEPPADPNTLPYVSSDSHGRMQNTLFRGSSWLSLYLGKTLLSSGPLVKVEVVALGSFDGWWCSPFPCGASDGGRPCFFVGGGCPYFFCNR